MMVTLLSSRVGLVLLCCAQLKLLLPQTVVVAFSTNNVPRRSTTTTRNNVSLPRRISSMTTALFVSTQPSTTDMELLPEIRSEILERGEDELQAWEECTQILSELFQEDEEGEESMAELYLADAFRWKAWASASDMMRKYQKPIVPDTNKLQEGIQWLKEGPLQMTTTQIQNNIREYPGIYLRDPHVMYKKVVGSAPRKYRDDDVLKQFIEDDPNILQVTFNCDGEGCQSECGSCWVAYESRLPTIPEF